MERVGLTLAQRHATQEAPTGSQLDAQRQSSESAVMEDIVDPPNIGCSIEAKRSALALATDNQLLIAFDHLAESLHDSNAVCLHAGLELSEVKSLIDGTSSALPILTPAKAIGSAAQDVGSLLASMIVVAVERAHAPGAPDPPAPTWPPAPLSSHSASHAAIDEFWHAYAACLKASTAQSDTTSLLKQSVGYAGCQLMRRTILGATSFATHLGERDCSRAEKCALAIGRELVLHSQLKLESIDGCLTILDSNLYSNKHSQSAAFEIFSDFADDF